MGQLGSSLPGRGGPDIDVNRLDVYCILGLGIGPVLCLSPWGR